LKTSIILSVLALLSQIAAAQDSKFHIYLCIGQSNMEGLAPIEDSDRVSSERFQILQAIDCPELGFQADSWRIAEPPLCQCHTGLSLVDQFGKVLVSELPEDIKIGVVHMAVGGCDIRLFDKDLYGDFDSTYEEAWFVDKVAAYGGNPYARLVELAKLAQESGVIKGLLLHQGETNTGDQNWPQYVAKIYRDLLEDLDLSASGVPLLAGELVHADQAGTCASMNEIIATLPALVENSHVISSSGCTTYDKIHFKSEGYREMGRRYARTMLEILDNPE